MELTRGERATSAMLLLLLKENFPPILPQEGHPISRPASGLEKSVPSPTKLEVMFEVAPISSAPSCWSRGSDVTAEQFTPIVVVRTHRGLPSLERSTNDFGWLG